MKSRSCVSSVQRTKKNKGKPTSKAGKHSKIKNIKPSRLLQLVIIVGVIKLALFLVVAMQPEPDAVQQSSTLQLTRPAIAASKPETRKKTAPSKKTAAKKPTNKQQYPIDIPAEIKRLKAKEKKLAQKEESLKQLEKELNARLKSLQAVEARIKKMLEEADVLKDKKIRHLVNMYASMKPEQAAKVIENMDEELSVKILSGMKGRKAGKILSFVEPKKAAKISEKLTELHAPFADDTR